MDNAKMSVKFLSVYEAVRLLNNALANLGFICVEGEVSAFKQYSSGHWYFTIKDSDAALSCVLWKSRSYGIRPPKLGDKVRLKGSANVWEKSGNLSFVASELSYAGEGELYEKFLRLKKELSDLGWFDHHRKKAIPRVPHRIGIITSRQGAAVRDAIHRLRERAPYASITVYDTPVQGVRNELKIARAIRYANLYGKDDVLLLIRGGGSIEDLWNFNERVVAEAIVQSRIPIISGIGHETDTTIADLAADRRAPTPTGAAEAAAEKLDVLRSEINTFWDRTELTFRKDGDQRYFDLEHFSARFENGRTFLEPFARHVNLASRLVRVDFARLHKETSSSLGVLAQGLSSLLEQEKSRTRSSYRQAQQSLTETVRAASMSVNYSGRPFEKAEMLLRPFIHSLKSVRYGFQWPMDLQTNRIQTAFYSLRNSCTERMNGRKDDVGRSYAWIRSFRPNLSAAKADAAAQSMRMVLSQKLSTGKTHLSGLDKLIKVLDPKLRLPEGAGYIFKNGQPVKRASELRFGDLIEIEMKDGKLVARVGAS